MKNLMTHFILALALCGVSISYSCDEHGKTGIVEENDLRIYAYDKANSNSMTKEQFIEVISEIEEIYKPIFASKGKTLHIRKDWEDGTVNAYAKLSSNNAMVVMSGGLARHPVITKDALALVVCHEVGHHIGGAPRKSISGYGGSAVTWASNEGQADYWGALKCLRKYLDGKDSVTHLESVDVPEEVKLTCEQKFDDVNAQSACVRTVLAGYSLANMFRTIRVSSGRSMPELSFVEKDPKIVKSMDDAHPRPQCRLDTYFSGAICDKEVSESVSYTDYDQGVCSKVRGYDFGIRPRCWFKPAVADLL